MGQGGSCTIVRVGLGTLVRVADSDSLPNARLVLLIQQLTEEFEAERGTDRGALPWVHERLGLSLSYVRKLASGERTNVTVEQIDKARQKMRLPWAFFMGATEHHYRDLQRRTDEDLPEAYLRFRDLYARFDELTEEQVDVLERMPFRDGPPQDPARYVSIAEQLLGGRPQPLRREETEANAKRLGVKKVAR